MTFMRYFSLPGLIAERLFSVFDKNHNEYLDISEFLEGMITLFSESYDKLAKFIFNFYDFDKDGYISREDIRTVLSYIPIRNGNHSVMKKFKLKLEKEDFKDRVESQDELHDLLDKCFKNSQVLDYQSFLKVIENVSSDIFLFILIFLLEKKPFSKKALQEYEGQRKYNTLFKVNKTPNPKLKSRFMVASPNLNSKFSPSVTIKKSPFWHTRNLSGNGGLPVGGSNNPPSVFENNLASIISKENGSKSKHADFLNKFVRPSGHPNLAANNVVLNNNNSPSRFAKPDVHHGHTRVNSAFSLTSSNIYLGNVAKPKTIIIDDNCEMKSDDSLKMNIEKLSLNEKNLKIISSKKNSQVHLNQQIPNGSSEENSNMSSNPKEETIIYLSNQSNDNQENILSTISEEYLTFNPIPGNCDSTGNLMLVDEDAEIKNVPIFRKHRNNLKNLEEDMNGSSSNVCHSSNKKDNAHVPLKDYSDLKILPAVKHKAANLANNLSNSTSMSMKNSLLNGEKVTVGNSVKFSFNAIQDESDEEQEDEVNHEGYLYKISRGKKLKKRYFKLIHKDLYNYRNKGDATHKGLHNLAGVFIHEGQPLQFNEYYFYSFTMIFCNKTRVYYSDNEKEYREWIENIKLATGYSNLTDFYEVREKLGNGKFGLVRLGLHKATGRKVAVKIMYKGDMTISDLELVKTEIEILKVCQHPYIIRLYDVYENAEYIYISKKIFKIGILYFYF
jgi:Ca2+-binding EF-hand superfamily protein